LATDVSSAKEREPPSSDRYRSSSTTFIATAMDLAMVSPAERHGELVADLAAERLCLRKA
jgi:hypothetical protein